MHYKVSEWIDEEPYIDRAFGYFALIKGINQEPLDFFLKKACWCEINLKYGNSRQMPLCLQFSDFDLYTNSYNFVLSE